MRTEHRGRGVGGRRRGAGGRERCGASLVPRPSSLAPASGFTLTEIMVVTVILLVLGAVLLTTFLTGRAAYISADASIQVQQEARKAFDNVVRELRESGTILCGSGAVACVANTAYKQLNFQVVKSYDPGTGLIQWGNDDVTPGSNKFLHYEIVDFQPTNDPTNDQLIRYSNNTRAGSWNIATRCAPAVSCRVLANNVCATATNGCATASTFKAEDTAADTDATPDLVTLTLRIQYGNAALSGGSRTTGPLTVKVKLRNTYP